ncbi:MAG: inner-membrane translocator, partial [Chloroflexota bacterium]|nr:inner-membrane translocator [Chloroflexota bacterium]
MSSDVSTQEESNQPVAPAAAPATQLAEQSLGQRLLHGDIGQLPAILMLALIVIIFQIISGGFFLKPVNISNLILQEASTALVALGAVMTLLLAEIDLSLAAVATLCGSVMVVLSVYQHWNAPTAILAGVIVGAIIGALNGVLVAVMRVPSFVVTLAAYLFYFGVNEHILLPQTTVRVIDPGITDIMTGYVTFPYDVLSPLPIIALYAWALIAERNHRIKLGLQVGPAWTMWGRIVAVLVIAVVGLLIFESALGVPYALYIVVGVIIVLWLALRFTIYGRHIYAVGGSPEAARRAGIRVTAIRISVFAIGSALAGLGGVLESSRTISAGAQVDPQLLLLAIAVAVIGGVSLFGGRGSVWGVVLGILII